MGPPTWNQSILANPIPLNQPLTITWTGGDPNGFVEITGISSSYVGSGTPSAATPGVVFECMAPTSAGSFTVPPFVLAALPTTGESSLYPTAYLEVGPASGAVKISPTPGGLDADYILYHYSQGGSFPAWTQ